MVVKPGIKEMDADGKPIYFDSVDNIKSLIDDELKFTVLENDTSVVKKIGPFSGESKFIIITKHAQNHDCDVNYVW
jgi:hypothetical protein